jgi:primosomal protein N' (replication factor Y)
VSRAGARGTAPELAEIAVPLSLRGALTYEIPAGLAPWLAPGQRVRVPLAKRSVTGVVWKLGVAAPPGVEPRPIERLLDLAPLLPPDLLELARFASDYYLAGPGEVTDAMLPEDLPAWGNRAVELTAAGTLAPPRGPVEDALFELLVARGRVRRGDLLAASPSPELPATLERWLAAGRLRELGGPALRRYDVAYGLAPGEPGALEARAGRSEQGRAALRFLAALGRPATAAELAAEAGTSAAVLARLARLGLLLRFDQPRHFDLERHLLRPLAEGAPIELLPEQAEALAAIVAACRDGFRAFLLQGVTGSGKTEVYLRAADAVLARGKSAIVLVPEIALVPALARAARDRFGPQLAVLHSGLGASERAQEWERIRRGEARLVVGPRSALFAPVAELGLVVVDEEQDPAYKQESPPRYHGRDLALVRCRRAGAVAVLASATPSLEARWAAKRGTARRLSLGRRVGDRPLPEGILVDLRAEPRVARAGEVVFSERLLAELARALAEGDQAILLRNRRGYAPLLLCRACGEEFRCVACGLPRTYHRRARRLICHWCGASELVPERCPSCRGETLEPIGAGTERVEEEVARRFPGVEVAVLDRDAAGRIGGAAAILERFRSGRTRILVGTQMLSKGHHFPNVALTAVLAADTYLGFPDFRAVERTYSLLTQLAGRAGRGEKPGRVVFQTFHPEHYAIRAALAHDDALFEAQEMRFRRLFDYPPFTRMALVVARAKRRDRALERLRELAERLHRRPAGGGLRITGPAPAPLERLKGEWRFQLVVRGPNGREVRAAVAAALGERYDPALAVDVDPVHLL